MLGMSTEVSAQSIKEQKKYLPKAMKKEGMYLGMSHNEFRFNCMGCISKASFGSFRAEYTDELKDKAFESVSYYVNTAEDNKLYEMILVANPDVDVNELALKLLGDPNDESGEWRFYPEETGFPFTLAAWTYKNKLILAADIKGSEWEEGFN